MMGLGMIAGTQAAHRIPKPACSIVSPSPRQVVVLGLGVIACGIALIAGAHCPLAAVFGGFVMGSGVGLLMVPAQTLIQSETPLAMVGRVSSGVMSLISIAQVSGLALSGISAAAIGLRPLFYASAMVLAALAAAGFWTLGREEAGKRSGGTQHVIAT
jgi:MFS family permease